MKGATTSTVTLLFITLIHHLHPAAASTSGSGDISVEDYPVFGPHSPNNPPFCGMPYDSLNLNLITAVATLTKSECGTCLEVCAKVGCANVLAVDHGGAGLDLSTGISKKVIGNDNGRGFARWKPVAKSKCKGIWDGRMFGEKRGVEAEVVEVEVKGRRRRRRGGNAAVVMRADGDSKAPVPTTLPPSPIPSPPTPTPTPSLTSLTLPVETSLLHLSSSNTTTNTTIPTVTVVTTVFPPTPTPPSTTSRTTTAPLDAVTYAYTNGASRLRNPVGEVLWKGRLWWWWMTGLVVVIAMEGGVWGLGKRIGWRDWEEEEGEKEKEGVEW
ncbi:MAG: hypothetical protein M1813_003109 [Trichoglossum hirsutum]|nr:MAG: hypothetical protein M1813_003109 [Trichoglossum hirsutum]